MNTSEHGDQLKARRAKSREVSSRFLSPSPNRRYSTQRGPRPLGNRDQKRHDQKPQRISLEDHSESTKENRGPLLLLDDDDGVIVPGRFSVDECALYRTSYSHNHETDSESSDVSYASNHSVATRKPGIQVPSKYLHDLQTRSSDCNNQALPENSRRVNNFGGNKSMVKTTDSLARYGCSKSQWALSPGRSSSPPLCLETKARLFSFSRLKPPLVGEPPRAKGVSKLFNLGLDFYKSNKSPLKPPDAEVVHQLKLLHNRLVQWRFVNARADAANNKTVARGKNQLLCAWDIISMLRLSVVQERIGLQKRKLEMKLDHMLLSQIKHLEAWEAIERRHLSALSTTKECLHSVVSVLPLTEGAEVDLESTFTIFKQAAAAADSINSTLERFACGTENLIPFVSELAELVAQERMMVEESRELLRTISELEIQERCLKCCYMIPHKQIGR